MANQLQKKDQVIQLIFRGVINKVILKIVKHAWQVPINQWFF